MRTLMSLALAAYALAWMPLLLFVGLMLWLSHWQMPSPTEMVRAWRAGHVTEGSIACLMWAVLILNPLTVGWLGSSRRRRA